MVKEKGAAEKLFNEHMGLAYHLAWKYKDRANYFRVDIDDIRQVALEGLWKAALNYIPNSEAKFSSYAWPTMKGCIINLLTSKAPIIHIPWEAKMKLYRIDSMENLEYKLGNMATAENELLHLDEVEKYMYCLTGRERAFVNVLFGLNGATQMDTDEIGKELGWHRQKIKRFKDSTMKKLRATAEVEGVKFQINKSQYLERRKVLSEKHRQICDLFVLEEIERQEISKQFGMKRTSAATVINRAFKKMKMTLR